MIKYPSDRTNIVMDLDPTKTPTEKIIKDEVVKRKLVFNDLGYVVLLSDKDDRTKRNPGLFLLILFLEEISWLIHRYTEKVSSTVVFFTRDNFFVTRSPNKSRWVISVYHICNIFVS